MFTDCQSGFIPGGSCISQLLSITQEIYKSFDCNPPEDGVFLDISKAFDKVWHEGLTFKLKTYRVEGKLIILLENYLKNRNLSLSLSLFVYVSSKCTDFVEKRVRFPQGLSLVL